MAEKEYFLAVNKKDHIEILEALSKLHGYVTAEADRQTDPQTGQPHTQTAELFQSVTRPLAKLQNALSPGTINFRDIDKVVAATRSELVKVIVNTIVNNKVPDLLPVALMQAIDKFEIIGRDSKAEFGEDDDLPF